MKQQEKTELTRQKIMALAFKEFSQNGYSGASLNSICKGGVPKGLFYHNFESKDALYLACVEQSFLMLTNHIKSADVGGSIKKYLNARLSFFIENKEQALVFFEAVLRPPYTLQNEILKIQKEFYGYNAKLYAEFLKETTLRSNVSVQDAMQYFELMQSAFNAHFSALASAGTGLNEMVAAHENALSKMLDYMLYGIAQGRNET